MIGERASEVSGTMTAHAERELTVEHWLLSAARDAETARAEWASHGVALLRCGSTFSAIRISASVVHQAAGTETPEAVAACLNAALEGEPAFLDRYAKRYYLLTSRSAGTLGWCLPNTERLGFGGYVGVPSVRIRQSGVTRAHWVVPVESPGTLCRPEFVVRLGIAGGILGARSTVSARLTPLEESRA
ncbi:hypothetical protein [Streptomyces sp. NPDC003077]|uniref:hypothetical protein n=1 Tax=Streptomyces sp. NPDC003077 TaxID=3154443 RepID=UPI0033B08EE0